MPATALRSSGGDCASGVLTISITPEDRTALVTQILEGLQAQLAGAVQLGLDRVMQETEHQLSAALAPGRSHGSLSGRNAAWVSLRSPAWRLNPQGNASTPLQGLIPESCAVPPIRRFSAPELRGPKVPPPTRDRRSRRSSTDDTGLRWLPWRRVNAGSSGLKGLGEVRDNELLAPWHEVHEQLPRHRYTPHATIPKEKGCLGHGLAAALNIGGKAASSGQDRSMEDDLMQRPGRPKEPAAVFPVASEAAEDRQSNASPTGSAVLPMHCLQAEKGSAANMVATAFTAAASSGRDDPLHTAQESREQEALSVVDAGGSPCEGSPRISTSTIQSTPTIPGLDAACPTAASAHQEPAAAVGTSAVGDNSPHRAPQRSVIRSLSFRRVSTDTQALRQKREEELLSEFGSSKSPPGTEREFPILPRDSSQSSVSKPSACVVQRVSSPLLLRLCGILPWGRFGAAYRSGMLLLAAGPVAVFAEQFYAAHSQIVGKAHCAMGICMHFGCLGDLVLAVGSFLGLVALRSLASLKLLGSPRALLTRYAVQHEAIWKWRCATAWQSLYLAVLWVGSLAFRAATVAPDFSLPAVVRACVFVLTSLIFMGLVFSVLHTSCLVCILIDSYATGVQERRGVDLDKDLLEWDQLGALIRKVSRALDRGFLLIQSTAVVLLLCSFSDFMINGAEQIWRLASTVLLGLSCVLILSKAAEVTEMCTRVPSVINSLDFRGDGFSLENHYLVEHIAYSATGFYIGDVRLTTAMVLKLMHLGILASFGVLTKLTTA